MGQPIEIVGSTVVGDVLIVDTDRSVSGQDGATYESLEEAQRSGIFPAQLARRIFEKIDGVAHVFSASNTVVIGRDGGWDDYTVRKVEDLVTRFFVFYETDEPASA
jgi:hypothetical protein